MYTTTAGGKNRHGHFYGFTPSQAPVVYRISGPMGGGFLYTTGAKAENSAVKFPRNQYHHCIKVGLPSAGALPTGGFYEYPLEVHA